MTYHLFVGLEFCEIISLDCMNEAQEHSHRRGRRLEKAAFECISVEIVHVRFHLVLNTSQGLLSLIFK